MDIYLTVSTDLNWDFYSEYDRLGHLQKKIWQVSVWWVKKFPNAFPSQQHLSEKVGCSRKHINSTFAKFQRLGWMHLTSRGIKHSKVIGIPSHLLSIDVVDRKAFRSIEVTTRVTHSKSYVLTNTSRGTGVFCKGLKEKIGPSEKKIEIPDYIKKTKLSLKHKLKLSMLPENIFHNALESTKYQHSKGILGNDRERIDNYMVGTAIRMAEKAQIKIDWPLYYKELRAS
jgi:hypothetical protein